MTNTIELIKIPEDIENPTAYEAAIRAHIRDNAARSFQSKFMPAHPEVDWEFAWKICWEKPESFIGKIMNAGRDYAKLSDKQLDALKNALAREIERRDNLEVKKLEWAAEAQALRDSGVVAPSGRVVVEGTVKTLKWTSSDFGDVLKMLVVVEAGWKVWSSVPRDLEDDVVVGNVIQFTATLTPKDDDALFAIGKRPAKAVILNAA
jgi:hypothetical protein